MPRESIVYRLINQNLPDIEHSIGPNQYLILYRFTGNPSTRFYKAFEQLARYIKIDKVQNGVIQAEDISSAYRVISLLNRYKGKCRLFRASEVLIQEIFEKYGSIK
jgi:hypothetical protein